MRRSKAGLFLGIYLTIFLYCCKTTEILDDLDRGWGNCYDMMELVEGSRPDNYDEGDFSEAFQDHFSEKSQVIANALNLKEELHNLLEGKSELDEVKYFIRYQNILNRISLAELEVSSLSAAVRCEEDKAEQLAWYLIRLESDRSSKSTVSGIIIDAASNIVGGIIILWIANGNTARQLLGVGASLTQIILNLANKSKSYGAVLDHDLNILDELYFEKDEPGKIIPPAVWYYINEEKILMWEGSIRDNLIKNWEAYNFRENKDLYLSGGGTYTIEQIRNRASMLDLFVSHISLMQQDLLLFRREVIALNAQL